MVFSVRSTKFQNSRCLPCPFPFHCSPSSNCSPMRADLPTASLNKLQWIKLFSLVFNFLFNHLVMFINFPFYLIFYCCVMLQDVKTQLFYFVLWPTNAQCAFVGHSTK